MKHEGVDFETVRELGLALPDAEEARYFGMPALKVGGKMFVVQAGHRSAERNSISVPVGFSRRDQLIAKAPDVFYLKPHYELYPVVLVRLERIARGALQRLLRRAYDAVSTGTVDPAGRASQSSRTRRTSRAGRTHIPVYW